MASFFDDIDPAEPKKKSFFDDIDESEQSQGGSFFDDIESIEPEEKTIGDHAEETFAPFGAGAGSFVGMIGDIYGLTTGDMDNALSKTGQRTREYWDSRKSDDLKGREKDLSERINAEETNLGKAGTAFWGTISDPKLMTAFAFEQAPNLIVGGIAGKGAGLAAKAAGAGAKAAGTAATAGAVGTGAAMGGADAGRQAYDKLLSIPDKLWAENKDYQSLRQQNIGHQEAKEQIALGLSRNNAAATAIVSGALSKVAGASHLEKVMAGVKLPGKGKITEAAKGFFGEALQEVGEEGVGAFGANVAAQKIDSSQDLSEGVAESMGKGAVGGIMGGAAGIASITESESIDEVIASTQKLFETEPATEQEVDVPDQINQEPAIDLEAILGPEIKDQIQQPESLGEILTPGQEAAPEPSPVIQPDVFREIQQAPEQAPVEQEPGFDPYAEEGLQQEQAPADTAVEQPIDEPVSVTDEDPLAYERQFRRENKEGLRGRGYKTEDNRSLTEKLGELESIKGQGTVPVTDSQLMESVLEEVSGPTANEIALDILNETFEYGPYSISQGQYERVKKYLEAGQTDIGGSMIDFNEPAAANESLAKPVKDTTGDTLLQWAGKQGKINTESAKSEGLDITSRKGLHNAFSGNGRDMDEMAIKAHEDGYIDAPDKNLLIDKLSEEVAGRPQYTKAGLEVQAGKDAVQIERDRLQQHLDSSEADFPSDLAKTTTIDSMMEYEADWTAERPVAEVPEATHEDSMVAALSLAAEERGVAPERVQEIVDRNEDFSSFAEDIGLEIEQVTTDAELQPTERQEGQGIPQEEAQAQEGQVNLDDTEEQTDMFGGEATPAQTSIAEARSRVEQKLTGEDVPADIDGGLFTEGQQTDLVDAVKEESDHKFEKRGDEIIRVSEREAPNGDIIQVEETANEIIEGIDGRIDGIKLLVNCLGK